MLHSNGRVEIQDDDQQSQNIGGGGQDGRHAIEHESHLGNSLGGLQHTDQPQQTQDVGVVHQPPLQIGKWHIVQHGHAEEEPSGEAIEDPRSGRSVLRPGHAHHQDHELHHVQQTEDSLHECKHVRVRGDVLHVIVGLGHNHHCVQQQDDVHDNIQLTGGVLVIRILVPDPLLENLHCLRLVDPGHLPLQRAVLGRDPESELNGVNHALELLLLQAAPLVIVESTEDVLHVTLV
mmetsp:Transcript_52617/g.139753  ORF Transcript_52617/g.139753 Transcript_52617/m.139753 type:complete len:234 (+) Transcript_52617:1677-2378(+)